MPFPPMYDNAWDETAPPDTQPANLLGQDIRTLKVDIRERLALLSGTLANIPTNLDASFGGAGYGYMYFATDTGQIFSWSGAAWVDITTNFFSTAKQLQTTGAPVVVNLSAPPTVGQVLIADSPTDAQWGSLGYKFEGSNVVPVTVANTIAATPLQVVAIAAGDLNTVGQMIVVRGHGKVSATGGGPTVTLALTLNGVILCSVIPVMTGGNNLAWAFEAFFTVLTTGAGGTLAGASLLYKSAVSGGVVTGESAAASAVDTTISNNIGLVATWSAASVQNSITQMAMSVSRMG